MAGELDDLLQRLLAEPESEWVERKLNWYDPKGVGRYVSALANSARIAGQRCGYLVWGVNDDGGFEGTKLDTRTKVPDKQPFLHWLKGRVTPKGHDIRIERGVLDGKRFEILVVGAATDVPIRFEGQPYIRVGSATPPLSEHPDIESRLLSALAASDFESDLAKDNATTDEVRELLDIDRALELVGLAPSLDPLKRLVSLGLLEPRADRWAIKNCGVILFARELAAFGQSYERKAPRVVFYNGASRVNAQREQVGTRGYAIAFEGLTGSP